VAGFAGVLEQAEALAEPRSTTTLARYLAITPGAVSQHLLALHNAGMVTRSRTGRSVLYRRTRSGDMLAAASAPDRTMVRMDEELSAELLERADRDQAARWRGRRACGLAAGPACAARSARGVPAPAQDAVTRGDASLADLAYLTDRVLMHRGEPQACGTRYQDEEPTRKLGRGRGQR
jgi:DNA-binding MarR family transcriptional regulator